MRRRESRRRSRHNRTSKSPAMWPGFLAAQIVREYSLLLIFLCKIFPEKLDKARGGRRGILDSPFQSTPPRGGDWGCRASARTDRGHFNPRPPRGGRLLELARRAGIPYISIHTPHEGGDSKSRKQNRQSDYFNPRPPRGGRRHCLAYSGVKCSISIHAPREGGDDVEHHPCGQHPISIHAPREGGDSGFATPIIGGKIISIHAPREGGRRQRLPPLTRDNAFQSTPPRGGRLKR